MLRIITLAACLLAAATAEAASSRVVKTVRRGPLGLRREVRVEEIRGPRAEQLRGHHAEQLRVPLHSVPFVIHPQPLIIFR